MVEVPAALLVPLLQPYSPVRPNRRGHGHGPASSALSSASFNQLDQSTWNIDMQELEYNPSKKDMTDAKIHHLLAEELCKPYRRVSA